MLSTHGPRSRLQYGEIPGYPVGFTWMDRKQLCASGVHATLRKGIQGNKKRGVRSIVLSGIYEDDTDDADLGEEFTYAGVGGHSDGPLGTGSKGPQTQDQKWKGENLALKRSFELQNPIRVFRGSKLGSRFAPLKGYRYDGLYTVANCDMVPGKSGYLVCLFRLVRCPGQPPISNHITRYPRSNTPVAHNPRPRRRPIIIGSESPSLLDPESDLESDTPMPMPVTNEFAEEIQEGSGYNVSVEARDVGQGGRGLSSEGRSRGP